MSMKRFTYLGLAALLAWGSIAAWVNYLNIGQQRELAASKLGLPPIAGDWYYADMKSGNEKSDGYLPSTAVCSLNTAYDKCVKGRGDGVCLLADSTSYSFYVSKTCTLDAMNSTIAAATIGNPNSNRARIVSRLHSAATSKSPVLLVTVPGVQLVNVSVVNEDTLGYLGIQLATTADYFYAKKCEFIGGAVTSVSESAACADVQIDSADNCLFEDCEISTYAVDRNPTGIQGRIYFRGPQYGNRFVRCNIKTWTDDQQHCAIRVGAANSMAGYQSFDDCLFAAWHDSSVPAIASMVHGTAQTSPGIILRHCSYLGYAAIDTLDNNLTYVEYNATYDDSTVHLSPQ